MAASWNLAPALDKLRKELNAKYPKRDKNMDGTIGDTAHQARTSEHNPDKYGVVRAIDIDKDGINVQELLNSTIGDPRVHYVIWNSKIYSRDSRWEARPYNGRNKHTEHIHISLRNQSSEKASKQVIDAAANDTSNWIKGSKPVVPSPVITVSLANSILAAKTDPKKKDQSTTDYSSVLPIENALVKEGLLKSNLADGHYGTATVAAYRKWQERQGYTGKDADGIPGMSSLKKLGDKYNFKVTAK